VGRERCEIYSIQRSHLIKRTARRSTLLLAGLRAATRSDASEEQLDWAEFYDVASKLVRQSFQPPSTDDGAACHSAIGWPVAGSRSGMGNIMMRLQARL